MRKLALVVTDLQADDSTEVLRSDATMPLQRWRVRQFYADALSLFRKHNCRYFIDLGDTTDTRANISWPVLAEISAGLRAINPDPLLSFKLIGNHEQVYKHTVESSASFYWRHHFVAPGRAVIDLGKDKPVVVLVSFPADYNELEDWLNQTAKRLAHRKTLLLGHFQVIGCTMNSGPSATGVSTGALKGFTLGLLGHVHKPQSLPGTNCHYIGSPFQQNFGESGEQKRLALLDLDALSLEWLKLPSRYPQYRQVSVSEFERCADTLGEDQLEVTLRSAEEAEKFYTHPRSGQVKTSLLHFSSNTEARPELDKVDLSQGSLLELYAKEHPVHGFTVEALVEAGQGFCR